MGRKDKKSKSKRVVLSLAEFNEDAGGNSELTTLPSAPKALEEWEAEGGRPEYNSRGYKERGPPLRERRFREGDGDFEDRDWTRRGPLDSNESSFGAPVGERDWGEMRRDAADGATAGGPARDWTDMRRGPVDSSFNSRGGGDRDWAARKGPVEAEVRIGSRMIDSSSWASARGNEVEASFDGVQTERNWSVRKGPIEADVSGDAPNPMGTDWGSARRGPVDSEFVAATQERDWADRKGPIEADPPAHPVKREWERKGPVEAEVQVLPQRPNWSGVRGRSPIDAQQASDDDAENQDRADADGPWARRGPVESKVDAAPTRLVSLGSEREDSWRGARLPDSYAAAESGERNSWRREGAGVPARGRRGRGGSRDGFVRPASTGHDATPIERDWGVARRSGPISVNAEGVDGETEDDCTDPNVVDVETLSAMENASKGDASGEPPIDEAGDEWTTVKANPKRESREARRAIKENTRSRGDGRALRGPRPLRNSFNSESKAPHTSPVTPLSSAASES